MMTGGNDFFIFSCFYLHYSSTSEAAKPIT